MDLMTMKVATISPANSVKHAAQVMLENRVSGLPVINDERNLVGILTEGDLLRRVELHTGRISPAELTGMSVKQRARAYVKSHSWNVADVMSANVVTVDERTPISQVAALMEEHNIKRVPVVREGRLVGIISRADLLRALVAAKFDDTAPGDGAIRRSILTRLSDDTGLDGSRLSVTVSNGVVRLGGSLASEDQRDAVRVIVDGVRGVAGIVDHLQIAQEAH
jgi:CBS-domain-containing membrane protein